MLNSIEALRVHDLIPRRAKEQEGLCYHADFWHLANLVDIYLAYQRNEMTYVNSRLIIFKRDNGQLFIGIKKGFSSTKADFGKISYLVVADPNGQILDNAIIFAINVDQTDYAIRQFDINLAFAKIPSFKTAIPFMIGYGLIQTGLKFFSLDESANDSYQQLYQQLKSWLLTTLVKPLLLSIATSQINVVG